MDNVHTSKVVFRSLVLINCSICSYHQTQTLAHSASMTHQTRSAACDTKAYFINRSRKIAISTQATVGVNGTPTTVASHATCCSCVCFMGQSTGRAQNQAVLKSTVASLKNVFVIIVRAVIPSVLTPSKSPAPPPDAAHCPQHPARPDPLRGTPSEGPEAHPLPSGPFGRLAMQSPLTVTFHLPRNLSATTRQVPPRSMSSAIKNTLGSNPRWLTESARSGVTNHRRHRVRAWFRAL